MKDCTDNLFLPAMNLAHRDWNENVIDIILLDTYFYSSSERKFKEYTNELKLIDSRGDIYIAIGKKDLPKWRKYIPFIAKSKILFARTGTHMTLEETKAFMLEKLQTLTSQVGVPEWAEQIENATNFEDLFLGDS